ncbi:MAG: glycosyltransferase family 4 protein [Coprobacter sp.]|nr:glycosyltransferase family 4 protein [Coprobacter sp.]
MKKCIDVVSFQHPYPPDYGGVIDVYFKLKALKAAGYAVRLHSYCYGRAADAATLADAADEVFFYSRRTGWKSQFSRRPYIVNSRRSPLLLNRLAGSDAPILFEGLHSCYGIDDPRLAHRIKIVRAHNIEHRYYSGLAQASSWGWRRLFFALEARRLQRYEPVLRHADGIAAVNEVELDYFRTAYPQAEALLLPCFYNDRPTFDSPPGDGDFVLYQGNLSVAENVRAALWIIDRIACRLPEVPFVLAGANPPAKLMRRAAGCGNVTVSANPAPEVLDRLVHEARAHLLLSFQPTGAKLKLLHALRNGAHVIANRPMLEGTGLEGFCFVADEPEELADCLRQAMLQPFGDGPRCLGDRYDNAANIARLDDFIARRISL